jgi:hypothetical protein
MEYTLNEYCNMYLMLGACGNRASIAAREYAERYPVRHLLDTNVFHQLDQRMTESGTLLPTALMDIGGLCIH